MCIRNIQRFDLILKILVPIVKLNASILLLQTNPETFNGIRNTQHIVLIWTLNNLVTTENIKLMFPIFPQITRKVVIWCYIDPYMSFLWGSQNPQKKDTTHALVPYHF